MEAVKLSRGEHAGPSEKGVAGFMAMKTLIEQRIWRWVEEKKEQLPFTFNTLLLDKVIWPCLDQKNQGILSTAGMVHWVWRTHTYGFYQMGEMLKEIFSRHADKVAQVENYGEDHTVGDTAVGKELLSRLSRNGEWRKLKESLADNAKS
ncbi:hypothetical protein QC764_214190 [Podospora pseudoanserina]|uniref:Uncharacterized protein n=1 Tax=Podospora pseudoanserina TaxID=2609844 RepID=A0ABR0IK05_9PEZI|nr:hypothetical protein QC764_214190 [Podospora pseudoanserina]